MSVVVVDLQRLQELRRQCAVLNDAFAERDHTVDAVVDSIGGQRMSDTIRGFESHWGEGHSKVRNHLNGMLARLDVAIATYRDCESELSLQIRDSQ